MFSKTKTMAKAADLEGGSRNHIAQGTKIKGDVETEGDLRIDGSLEGSIISKGKLVVGSTGEVKGEIKCVNANISGKVQGQMVVAEMLAVTASGFFSGDMTYGKMSVEPGAQLEGTFTIAGKMKDISSNDKRRQAQAERTA